MSKVLKGGCMCGAVRYEVAAEPVVTGFCHCLSCQKLSGAGRAFHVMVPKAAFAVTGPSTGYAWKADSGATVTSFFCTVCGSPTHAGTTSMPDAMTFRATSLDDPAAIAPQMTVYSKRVQPWDHVEPGLPAFETMPPLPGMA